MEEDWCQSVLHKDCFISSAANNCDNDMALHLSTFDPDDTFDETLSKIKMEPSDETSDYHGSSSGSPSSSLSSPNNFREDQLNIDLTLCGMFNNFSPPPGSSHSPGFGMMNEQMPQQHSPLPPVAHFSQTIHHQPQVEMPSMMLHQQPEHRYSNNNNNPNNNFGFRDSMMYEGIGGMGLAAAHLQLKSRNKMHEMAVRQRLISDQAHQGNGDVQLSAEETRTLIQEGYDVPRSLPLSKSEEEALKIVRRKIKNKLSAQESRRKRKEYLDALEIRVQGCIQENKYLKTKIRSLEMENQDLKLKLQQVETSQ